MIPKKVKRSFTSPQFRVSFPHLFKPYAPPGSDNAPVYSVDMIFTAKADLAKFQTGFNEIFTELYGSDKKKWPKVQYPMIKDGNTKVDKKGEIMPGYENAFFITAKSKDQVRVVDQDKQEILDERKIYGGCYARIAATLSSYDNKGNKGVSCYMNGFQFLKDGEPFGGARFDVDKAFGDDIPDDGADDPSNYSDSESNEVTDDAGF